MENPSDNSITDTPENVRLLNEKLGITSRENLFNSSGIKSINDLFESSKKDFEILCRDISEQKEELEAAEKEADTKFDTFKVISGTKSVDSDTKLAVIESATASLSNFNDAVQSMRQLVDRGNDIMAKIYDAVVNTDIIDPDLLNAASTIIHSVRESNDNIIQFYTQKMMLEQQYKLAIESEKLKQKHKLEFEFFKHKLKEQEMETKARLKKEEENSKPIEVSVSGQNGTMSWDQSKMAEIIRSGKQSD